MILQLQMKRSYFSELIKVGLPGTVSLETNIPLYLDFFISILRHGESDKKYYKWNLFVNEESKNHLNNYFSLQSFTYPVQMTRATRSQRQTNILELELLNLIIRRKDLSMMDPNTIVLPEHINDMIICKLIRMNKIRLNKKMINH